MRTECSQFSIIFVLATQYRSHSVLLASAAHCPRWFLSMGSRRLHSMQLGVGADSDAVEMDSQTVVPDA